MRSVVHVLSPGLSARGEIVDVAGGVYVGGDVRMRAAVALAQIHPDFDFCMVGGGDTTPNSFATTSAKTKQMADFLCRRGIDSSRVAELSSLPCTFRNMAAIVLSGLERYIHGTAEPLQILTNRYHVSRAELFVRKAWEGPLRYFDFPGVTWHSAEDILGMPEEDLFTAYPEAYQCRLELETQGQKDIMAGNYTDSCRQRYGRAITDAFKSGTVNYAQLAGPTEVYKEFDVRPSMAAYIPR